MLTGVPYLLLLIIKGMLYLALWGVLLWVAWEIVKLPKDKPRPNRRSRGAGGPP